MDNRPTAHEDKYKNWSDCYVLTQTNDHTSYFNDGTIQYIEDELNKLINSLNTYYNETRQTTSGSANDSDKDDCDEYLDEALKRLYVLGLDLYTKREKDTTLQLFGEIDESSLSCSQLLNSDEETMEDYKVLKDENINHSSSDNNEDFAGTKIHSFTILGKTYKYDSPVAWKKMLIQVFKDIDSVKHDALYRLAKEGFSANAKRKTSKFHLASAPQNLREDEKISDGIYIESNLSADMIYKVIKSIMQALKIPSTAFSVETTRSDKEKEGRDSTLVQSNTDVSRVENLAPPTTIYFYKLKKYNTVARMIVNSTNEYVVLKGSDIIPATYHTNPDSQALKLQAKYKTDILDGKTIKDISFKSSSAAAKFVGGCSLSGNVVWVDSNGISLGKKNTTKS